jgi:hypothetical protein
MPQRFLLLTSVSSALVDVLPLEFIVAACAVECNKTPGAMVMVPATAAFDKKSRLDLFVVDLLVESVITC